jgi:hypothetical protein
MENIYNKVIKIKYDIYKKNKLFQYNSFIDENLKYMGLSGVDENGKIRKLYKPPTDPSELTKDINTYIWNIDPNVIPHLKKYESDKGLYYLKDKNEQIPSLQFIPIEDLDQKIITDVQTYINNAYSYVDKLFEYPYELFNMHHRNVYKGYELDYAKEIMDLTAKHSENILNLDNEFKSNFKLNEIHKIKLNRATNKNKCNKIKKINNKIFDSDHEINNESDNKKYYINKGLNYKQKQALLKNKERRCDNIHKVVGRVNKNNNKNKILLQDLLINFKLDTSQTRQLLFGNQPFVSRYNNNNKILIDPFIDNYLELGFLSYNKMTNKAITPCVIKNSDILFPCRVLINLNLNYNYFDNKANSILNNEYTYIGFFLVRLNINSNIEIQMSDKCRKYYNFKDTYLPKSTEQYYVLFIYKKNSWNEFDQLKKKIIYHNYFIINYRCNFVNMGEITEYKRILYTEIQQLICMNTKNNAYFYILLKIKNNSYKPIDINTYIRNRCNYILESNNNKKKK